MMPMNDVITDTALEVTQLSVLLIALTTLREEVVVQPRILPIARFIVSALEVVNDTILPTDFTTLREEVVVHPRVLLADLITLKADVVVQLKFLPTDLITLTVLVVVKATVSPCVIARAVLTALVVVQPKI